MCTAGWCTRGGCTGRVLQTGYGTEWVYRVDNTGTPSQPALLEEPSPPTSDRRERALPGAGWVGSRAGRTYLGWGTAAVPEPTPAGPGQLTRGLPWFWALIAALQPKGRDFRTFLRNIVKTAKCHRKVCIRPAIVPVCQNGLRNSPLDFLRIPFSPAFSPKELMGHFRPYSGLYCQNDEVSPDVHTSVPTCSVAGTVSDTPSARTPG